MRGKLPQFRALAISLLLVLGFIAGWPSRIPKMVAPWPEPLAAIALRLPGLLATLLAPFAPVAGALGIASEDWPLFTGTGGTRYRIWVEAQDRKTPAWTLFYRAHDPEHTALQEPLEYRRVLNLWNPHHDYISDGYPALVSWVAREIFREHRRVQRVRVRMEEVRIRGRGEGFSPTGRFVYEETRSREEVLP